MTKLDNKETRSGVVESNNNDGVDDLKVLAGHLREFAAARDWNQFHSPKNLAMALAGECGEVLEHFQWLTEADSAALDETKLRDVSHELADVMIYMVRMADMLGIDLLQAAYEKMALTDARYPAARVQGDARRASEYPQNERLSGDRSA